MPIKGKTTRPQHEIDTAVKRFMNGEQAVVLAKHYKISKPGFYLWVKKYKEELLKNERRGDLSAKDAEVVDKRALIAEVQSLRAEVRTLRDKVISMMIKAGEL